MAFVGLSGLFLGAVLMAGAPLAARAGNECYYGDDQTASVGDRAHRHGIYNECVSNGMEDLYWSPVEELEHEGGNNPDLTGYATSVELDRVEHIATAAALANDQSSQIADGDDEVRRALGADIAENRDDITATRSAVAGHQGRLATHHWRIKRNWDAVRDLRQRVSVLEASRTGSTNNLVAAATAFQLSPARHHFSISASKAGTHGALPMNLSHKLGRGSGLLSFSYDPLAEVGSANLSWGW